MQEGVGKALGPDSPAGGARGGGEGPLPPGSVPKGGGGGGEGGDKDEAMQPPGGEKPGTVHIANTRSGNTLLFLINRV